MLELHQLDVYQEAAPDNIALPLESGNELVWVRRASTSPPPTASPSRSTSAGCTGLGDDAGAALRGLDPGMSWPEAVQQVTGRTIATVQQNTRARGANPFEAATFGIPDATTVLVSHLTTYDAAHQPIEHSRFAWPTDAVRISDEYSWSAPTWRRPWLAAWGCVIVVPCPPAARTRCRGGLPSGGAPAHAHPGRRVPP